MSALSTKAYRRHGFTLIELLVAISVFAVMSVMAFTGLRSVLQAQEVIEQNTATLGRVQLAINLLERDLGQAVQRAIRGHLGGSLPMLSGSPTAFELTRTAWANPLSQQRSSLQRVQYSWSVGDLTRTYWNVLDRSQSSNPHPQQLLTQIEDFRLRYRDSKGRWSNQWPTGSAADQWPTAVEFRLDLAGFGLVHRVVPLAEESPGLRDALAAGRAFTAGNKLKGP